MILVIDTILIYHCFSTVAEFYKTMGRVSKFMKENNLNNLHGGLTNGGHSFGFEEIFFYPKRDVGFYAVYIKLRPKLLICKNNYINTMYPSDIKMVEKEFRKRSEALGIPYQDIMTYKVKRVDYAVDVTIPPEQIPKYIHLFKQGNTPQNLLNEKTSYYFDADNNLYLVGKNYNINFYNRYDTLCIKQADNKKAYSCIERTKGKLRFEVQLKKIDTNKLKRRGLIEENSVKDFFNPDVAEYVILNHFDKIIGKGDYMSYFKALGKLKSENAKDILSRIKSAGSIYKAKEQYISEHNDKRKAEQTFSSALSYIRERNINPVTLDAGEDKIINPRKLICEYFDNKNKIFLTRRCDLEEEN